MRVLILVMMVVLAYAGTAIAHPQKAAITEILFNERTGNIEVAHRFSIHDAEHAALKIGEERPDFLGDPNAQKQFQDYAASRFALLTQDHTPLPLTLLGSEIEGDHLWVYVETPIPEDLSVLIIRNDILRDIWPEQSNLVNVKFGSVVRTATFDGSDQFKTIALNPEAPFSER